MLCSFHQFVNESHRYTSSKEILQGTSMSINFIKSLIVLCLPHGFIYKNIKAAKVNVERTWTRSCISEILVLGKPFLISTSD